MFLVQNTIERVLLSHCTVTLTVFRAHTYKVNNIGICPYIFHAVEITSSTVLYCTVE